MAVAVTAACNGIPGLSREDEPIELLEAYALVNEIAPGDAVPVAARAERTVAATWQVDRVGWYPGAYTKTFASGTATIEPRAVPAPDPKTGLVEAGWPASFTIRTATSWPAGAYVVTIVGGSRRTYALFVVNDQQRHDFYVQLSFSTYAAYNTWGGFSLYTNLTGTDLTRASQVSLDRPLQDNGLGDFVRFERNFIRWVERAGYDVGYTTNMGVDATADLSSRMDMFMMIGHDEYWSQGEREHVDAAVAQGMHLSSFAGNSAYWRINYHPSADGRARRVIECYKTGPGADATKTALWRAYKPEGNLLGGQFGWIVDSWAPLVITDVSNPIFAGTDIRAGDQFPGLMGHEVDGYYPPAGGSLVGQAPLIDYLERLGNAGMVIRTMPSGAQVFQAGTLRWGEGLAGPYGSWRLQKLTANIMAPAGRPRIEPHYLAENRLPEVHRWIETEVSTVLKNAGEPRTIVRAGGRTFYVAAREREVRELLADGTAVPYLTQTPAIVGLAADAEGNLWATDMTEHAIWRSVGGAPFEKVSATGGAGYHDGPLGEALFANPTQITTDGKRFLIVEHRRESSRLRVIEDGIVRSLEAGDFVFYTGIPVAGAGFLVGLSDNRLWSIDGRGDYSIFSGGTGGWHDANAKSARYLTPYWILPNQLGYYVVERYGHRIRFVSSAGGSWTVAGEGIGYADGAGDRARFSIPYGVVEENARTLLVTDAGNDAIRRVKISRLPTE